MQLHHSPQDLTAPPMLPMKQTGMPALAPNALMRAFCPSSANIFVIARASHSLTPMLPNSIRGYFAYFFTMIPAIG